MNLATNSKERFTSRVGDYIRFRPGYPPEIIGVLRDECGLTQGSVIADIGSGTGILTQLFLENGNEVYGVEPNAAMRQAGEEFLKNYPRFRSVAGSAESTTLSDASMDFVVAGQAFHWFDRAAARREFLRILRSQGRVALIWNERDVNHSPFMREFERILKQHSSGYSEIQHVYARRATFDGFFASGEVAFNEFENSQSLDWEGIKGRLMSASYAPRIGEPEHEPMIEDLKRVFAMHQQNGRVAIFYRACIHCGRLGNIPDRKDA
jgi:SAM-dependent methyltransferase